MTNIVSVITPVYAPVATYLQDAYESLRQQRLPQGWEWEWIVQQDGIDDGVAELLPDDPKISFGQGRRSGPAAARTVALARSRGELIKSLDADDMLTAGALEREIAVMHEHPEVGWTTTRTLDLLPDGSTASWEEQDPPEGVMSGGSVFEYWLSHNYRPPVVPGTLCIRRALIVALGGWMALPASEDTGLLIAASVIRPGYFIAEPGLLYRKWAGQSTAQPAHVDPTELTARATIIEARARALMRAVHPGGLG